MVRYFYWTEGRLTTTKTLLALAGICVIAAFMYLLLVPQGSYVYVLVQVSENSVEISQCALKKIHLINILRPEGDVTTGDRELVLKVFLDQAEMTSSRRENVGTGDCVLESSALSQDTPINSELTIVVQLYDVDNVMIAQAQTSLMYG